jgi:hypothetical protein
VLPMTERQEQDLDALFRQAEETSAEVS